MRDPVMKTRPSHTSVAAAASLGSITGPVVVGTGARLDFSANVTYIGKNVTVEVPIVFTGNVVKESKYGVAVWSENNGPADAATAKIVNKGNVLVVRGIAGNPSEEIYESHALAEWGFCPYPLIHPPADLNGLLLGIETFRSSRCRKTSSWPFGRAAANSRNALSIAS